ncbi:MAG: hypothetical protein HQK78_00490 [Desulfobacterales bacterium]|nr:hypothetical protein [Desulfobacterales bacterium]
MIEVIIVLILIGIISAVAYKSVPQDTMIQGTEFDKLVSHIRYVQTVSMARSESWSISIDASSYSLKNPSNVNVLLPGEDNTTINLRSLKITGPATPITIKFDSKGRPIDNSAKILSDQTKTTIDTNYGKQIIVVVYTGLVTIK